MKCLIAAFLVVSLAAVSGSMIVKSNHRWERNANGLMLTLTPAVLKSSCGQPAADFISGSKINVRQLFYPTSRDKSMGIVFTFHRMPGRTEWAYSSFHLGMTKKGEMRLLEDVKGSNSFALIELPCLGASTRRQDNPQYHTIASTRDFSAGPLSR